MSVFVQRHDTTPLATAHSNQKSVVVKGPEWLVAPLISKLSKTQVVMVKNYKEIEIFLKKNLISNEIIIGMGAGSISKYMRDLKEVI